MPGVSSPVENRSCPESTHCCSQCVIPLSWCQSVFDGWVMAEWLRRWLQQWVARGVSEIMVFQVQHWHPPHEAICSYLVFTLLPVHGDIFSYASFIQNNIYTSVPGVRGPVENSSCPESTRYCCQCVIPLSWSQSVFDGWVMAEWLRRWLQQWAARGVYEILGVPGGLRFSTCIHLMKQFAHDWYLPRGQCTGTCSRVSFIQNNI